MKPTKAQLETLTVLARDGERCAYPGLSIATLDALVRYGLASVRVSARGALFSPRTGRNYSITEAGRQCLAQQ